MRELVIGLGSNLGDRLANLNEAVRRMSELFGPPVKISSFIETEPWGYHSGNRYLNGAAVFGIEMGRSEDVEMWKCDVMNFLRFLKGIEEDMGRIRTGDGYADRTIDLDILFYGDRIIRTPELTVPHPHLHEREFVLRPLMEICPQKVHPVLGLTIAEIVRRGEEW